MGSLDKFKKKEKTDLRLMFLFWHTEQKETCNLREVQVLDISPNDDFDVDKSYRIPKEIRKICYDSKLISKFQQVLNQLYENAASKNYSELLIIIDKLNKKEVLEDNERRLLAKYPFILNDSPNMALINLEKAKKRVDLIKRAFGK